MRSTPPVMLICCFVSFVLLAGCASYARPAAPQLAQRSEDDVFLDHLRGRWIMVGDVRGHNVRYRAEGHRALRGGWLEFDMVDEARPSQYQASLFISADANAHDYVAHWLDQFGAAGARVAATGAREGNTLRLTFPYTEGAFRNVWSFNPQSGRWDLAIEAQDPAGNWRHFARYEIRPM